MSRYILQIKCMSDICVSDGGVYNSSVDIDICYDRMGFPFIPAKRIKGCLRECAQELNDWGEDIPEDIIFGTQGSSRGNLLIRNAYIKDYADMQKEVQKGAGNILVHPQNILKNFTYFRTQTSIDQDTGVAEENSLRTMRVVKKGVLFEAEVLLDNVYEEAVRRCCHILKHMGVSRTRGLGEVCVTLLSDEKKKENSRTVKWIDGADKLEYSLYLEEPVICKSVNGQEARTMDYIDGAKILGLIAQRSKADGKQAFINLMEKGDLICSNAYLSKDDIRYIEVPATLYSIKNNKKEYVDKVYTSTDQEKEYSDKGRQLNPIKHAYVNYGSGQALCVLDVEIEERYHHRRPSDKGIGHVKEDDREKDSMFYQMASICKGQTFKGTITGSTEQIKKVYEYLTKDSSVWIGQSKGTEYGKTQLQVTKTEKQKKEYVKQKEFIAILQSPTIIYGNNAAYSTKVKDLREEILPRALDTVKRNEEKEQNYIRFVTVGGFNVTWGYRKPMLEAFDKGSVLLFSFDEEVELCINEPYWVGERCNEGYGEVMFYPLRKEGRSCNEYANVEGKNTSDTGKINGKDSEFLQQLIGLTFERFLTSDCMIRTKEKEVEKILAFASAKPTINNMILMCKEMNGLDQVKNAIRERYGKKSENKQNKGNVANSIVNYVEDNVQDLVEKYLKIYGVTDINIPEEKIAFDFLAAFLLQLKYALRAKEIVRKEEKNE